VSLIHYPDKKFCLTISDNGVGIPKDMDFKDAESLGFRLTNNLTQQLEGEILLDRSNGTKFQIIFEELEYETRIGIKETIITAYKSRELRRHAEEIINSRIGDLNDIPKDFKELVRDLQVHQIEIEMQKEELTKSRQEIMDSRKRYFDIYNSAPVGYFTLTKDEIIIDVNNTGASILGITKSGLFNSSFISFLKLDSRKTFIEHNINAIETGRKQGYKLEIIRAEGEPFMAYVETTPNYDKEGKFKEFQTSIIDITRYK
jgi:PAS domain S-box-containing protein